MSKAKPHKSEPLSYRMVPTADLIPYANNAREHSPEQVSQIAASIKEFGFLSPVVTDGENGLLAGHGRLLAAAKLKLAEVPAIEAAHLTEAQRKAYIIADNKLAEQASWNEQLLKLELEGLAELDFDLSLTGFGTDDLSRIMGYDLDEAEDEGDASNGYTQKVTIPTYEPSGKCPAVGDLWDTTRTNKLKDRIKAAKVPSAVEKFLLAAAERFTEFRFDFIADFYAHAAPEVQELMEDSALVIIDFDKAIERGFVQLKSDVDETFAEDYPDA